MAKKESDMAAQREAHASDYMNWAKTRSRARFNLATGTPYTPIVGGVTRHEYDPSTDRWGTGDPEILI